MSLTSDLLQGFAAAYAESPATVTFTNGATSYTVSAYKSYSSGIRYEYDGHGNKKQFNELTLLVVTSEIASSNITPLKTEVSISGDSNTYYVGNLRTDNPVFTMVTLRSDI